MNEVDKNIFSKRLKALRLEQNLTQKQLAAILDVTERTYQRLETAKTYPSYKTVLALHKYFGGDTLDYILGVSDEPISH